MPDAGHMHRNGQRYEPGKDSSIVFISVAQIS